MITQAFVLGAGLGTRLRPLTDDLPKPLIPIFQKPLITFALDHLCGLGVKSFVINTHHLPEQFDDVFGRAAAPRRPESAGLRGPGGQPYSPALSGRGAYRDREIVFQNEPVLLGTGGGLKNVEGLLRDEPFIVYSGDILADFDLAPLIEEHFRAGNDVTLALRKTKLGAGITLQEGRVVDIESKYEPADFSEDSATSEPLVYSDHHGMDWARRQDRWRRSGRRQVVQYWFPC
jgi:mannose-1-phosphate guanylyltransferase